MLASKRISVVVAVYNGEAFVGDAIESILGQSLVPDEVCVVDDGSSDGTAAVVLRYPQVRLLRREKNQGQPSALNWGVASTTGDYLAFLDADDVWLPGKLEHQRKAFDADPSLDVVFGSMRERVSGAAAGLARRDGGVRPAQLPSAMLIKRTAFETVGGFDDRWKLGSVVDWYARSREASLSELVLPEVVYERRIHGENAGIKHVAHRDDYLSVVKAAIDRRRAALSAAAEGVARAREDERGGG